MAKTYLTISAPVGIRNGQTWMPNTPADMAIATYLFDRIPVSKGGTAEIGLWASERSLLITELTGQIVTFQTVNQRPVIDGVIDPNGGTLKLMNQLAGDSPVPVGSITATVVSAPDKHFESFVSTMLVADPVSLPGFVPLRKTSLTAECIRRLVRVDGSSITWFGVVVPLSSPDSTLGSVPHVNFTPSPIQGGYWDANYDSFRGWGQLWDDYTAVIGSQMVAPGANQVLVIPFYRTSQHQNLGDFLSNWREAIAAAVTAAILSIDPSRLRTTFTFDRIVSSSFSNGWIPHKQFNTQAAGAAAMTDVLFDLDGVSAHPSSNWRPDNGVIYLNKTPPGSDNPVGGKHWYVGSRWKDFAQIYVGGMNTHHCCLNHLLYHGLRQYCS